MTTFAFASSSRTLLSGAHHVVVVAPQHRLRKAGLIPKLLDRRDTDLLLRLAAETAPGLRGARNATLTNASTWLHVAVLPDRVSRYNCAARADSITHTLQGAPWGTKGKVAVVLLLDDPEHLLAAVNAVARTVPGFSARSEASRVRVVVLAFGPDGKPLAVPRSIDATVAWARRAAELVDTPAADLHPTAFAGHVREAFAKSYEYSEIVGDKLLARGLGGIHAVGRAAVEPPRLVVVRRRGQQPGPHIALVGKGVCFDTGGLHIKARGMMETMKSDMGGAAAVMGAFGALAPQPLAGDLSLILCLAENAVDRRSYKPDDILRLHSGRTVEINNTDAEGRLLLADGVSWAARELAADIIIDAATLTGAQLVATGLVHAAVMSNDAQLEATAVAAGQESGDLVHPLPFAPELYMHEFHSPVADMRNSVANRNNAQSSCAAQFIYAHLADAPRAAHRRWCHIDLAGPAFPKDRATGFGVALISQMVRHLAV